MTGPDRGSEKKRLNRVPTPARLVAQRRSVDASAPVVLGFLGMILVHVALLVFAPTHFPRSSAEFQPRAAERLQVFLTEPDEPDPPEEFVLTNPEVPANPPDDTHRFSDRNQQAAQEERRTDGDPTLPHLEGEEPEPTQNIVEGETNIAQLEFWETFPRDGSDPGGAFQLPPALPVPGFEETQEEEGLEVPVTPDGEPVDELVIGVDLDGSGRDGQATGDEEAAGPVMPRQRPTLSQFSRGPVGNRAGAAPRVGTIAVDANFSEFGDYLSRMLDAIVRQWHLLAWDSLQAGEVGTVVAVSFQIDSNGEVWELEVQHSTASLIATVICKDAIASRQPFGAWTPDMKEILGEEQTVRIRFHYR